MQSDDKLVMNRDNVDMRCPKCRRFTLKELDAGIKCSFCGNQLSRGQSTNFRLYKLLKDGQKQKKYTYKK